MAARAAVRPKAAVYTHIHTPEIVSTGVFKTEGHADKRQKIMGSFFVS